MSRVSLRKKNIMRHQMIYTLFIVFVLTCIILISSILSTYGNCKYWNKKLHFNSLLTLGMHPRLKLGTVNLTDGVYTYNLNFSEFWTEFPYLQSYQCSLKLTPHGQFEKKSTRPLLILAIKSHPAFSTRRAMLRQTWATEREVNGYWVKPIFLTAQADNPRQMELMKSESREFGDILQWNFTESHNNLSLKERCFLEWLQYHIPWVAFIFKGDDDEYVNPYAVVKYIKEHGSSPLTSHGYLRPHSAVMRHTKYRISENLYPFHLFPDFLSGGGFLFPGHSVKKLYDASKKIPVFPLDDVYFGFLALAANLTFRHDERFHVYGLAYNVCRYQQALVVHGIGPERMMKIYNEVQKAQCKD
ncbi:acetylgalactosaminyl-O-glycosyl-glycoprotein beta-1,3-N-acetylglucosaminyltransferase-like [Pelobates fuscus]|uniref:acetylgalactosaminyl-O-glycosyl-glycoprotein beta-1,3-N-acetylglucosaminyltransferase-like n=1 Tax=Pelobates fuscus TaxID=191477 RepID=UPI002FE4D346